MAPQGSEHIKEEWRNIHKHLVERFPTVPGLRISEILHAHDGHAGEAARALRKLVSTEVAEADPDDVEHVSVLLSSPPMFKHACKEQFQKFDVNGDGSLEWDEIRQLVSSLYAEFGLQSPPEGSLRAFFIATDENRDGVLSCEEFRKFFEMFLRYSFFDHLKLREVVEAGKAIQLQNPGKEAFGDDNVVASRRSSVASIGRQTKEYMFDDQPKPALVPIECSKMTSKKLSQCVSLPSLSPSHQSRSPTASPMNVGSVHRWKQHSPHKGKARHHESVPCTSGRKFERKMRCAAPQGVAYRATPAFNDRTREAVSKGESVQVLETWIRTSHGWLPMLDAHGRCLFEHDVEDRHHAHGNADKRLSPHVRDVSHSAVRRNSQRAPRPIEEEWRPLYERLCERFPNISDDNIAEAVCASEGHGGKAASMIRCM